MSRAQCKVLCIDGEPSVSVVPRIRETREPGVYLSFIGANLRVGTDPGEMVAVAGAWAPAHGVPTSTSSGELLIGALTRRILREDLCGHAPAGRRGIGWRPVQLMPVALPLEKQDLVESLLQRRV